MYWSYGLDFLPLPLYIFIPLLIWSLFWKGLALWTAGNRKEKIWFIILFLVNIVGILEIIYLLTRKKSKKRKK